MPDLFFLWKKNWQKAMPIQYKFRELLTQLLGTAGNILKLRELGRGIDRFLQRILRHVPSKFECQ